MKPYDLIVIGSGPVGQRAAIQGAKAGKRVAVVEKHSAIGGVCINTGTIPSTTMREAVLHLSGFYSRNFYGANHTAAENITMADLIFRVQRVVENEVGVAQDQLKRNGVDVIHGTGKFPDAHHLPRSLRRIVRCPSTGATSLIVTKSCVCHRFRGRSSLWAAASLASSMPARCHTRRASYHCRKAPAPARICRYRNRRGAELPDA
jgi:FAD dependent oxidoreductase